MLFRYRVKLLFEDLIHGILVSALLLSVILLSILLRFLHCI